MNNCSLLLLFLLILSSCSKKPSTEVNRELPETTKARDIEVKAIADLSFDKKIVDFGDVKQGEILEAVYPFENIGSNPLIIEYVNPDCTCTDYSIESSNLQVGETSKIELTLDTKNKIGKQRIFAVVKANTRTKFYRLLLKANVIK